MPPVLIDTNLLVYAHVTSFVQHDAARAWLDERLNGSAPVGLAWPALLSFVRLVSNPRVFERPEPLEHAWKQVEDWLDSPRAWVPQPTDRHRAVLSSLLTQVGGRANLVPDAHLVALLKQHGVRTLYTRDTDFRKFASLDVRDPFAQ